MRFFNWLKSFFVTHPGEVAAAEREAEVIAGAVVHAAAAALLTGSPAAGVATAAEHAALLTVVGQIEARDKV